MAERTMNRIELDNCSGIKLVLTEICDRCDVERPTTLCATCKQTLCDDCVDGHNCEKYEEHNQ